MSSVTDEVTKDNKPRGSSGQPYESIEERLRHLLSLMTAHYDQQDHFYRAQIEYGCHIFGSAGGMVIRRIGDMARIVYQYPENNIVGLDNYYDLKSAYCAEIIEKQVALSFFSAKERGEKYQPLSYNWSNISNYIGSPLIVGDGVFGVLCFFSAASSDKKRFSDEDYETINLMAKGVAKMIELQNPQIKDPNSGKPEFATPGVKTFEEYLLQARLPEVYGVPGRVVEVLKRRISHSSLSIDNVAKELNLSKRTLQRRLQQQNISFAELRDQVRFHYSIDYLIEQSMSIDSISSSLDFSDRTSFTNAFKRWTNLSPSVFRKLFRDYA